MKIAIVMLSSKSGGVEQAAVDYCEALLGRGHEVTAIIPPDAAILPQIKALKIALLTMRHLGEWDIFAVFRLRKKLKNLAPDIIIGGSNRSCAMVKRAASTIAPVVGVTHNYNIERILMADGLFATTKDLANELTKRGVEESRIYRVPNMVRCRELPQRHSRATPPVIGTMGRFVTKKGFDVFIDALHILHERGHAFTAIIGGTGEEEAALKKRAEKLSEKIRFIGWVLDKKAFFGSIDIFCLPSLHEPFGIVLLEAFTYGVPVVATSSEGPLDIITPNYDALLAEKGNSSALADALARVLSDTALAESLAANAFVKTKTVFSMEVVAERMEQACLSIIERWKTTTSPK